MPNHRRNGILDVLWSPLLWFPLIAALTFFFGDSNHFFRYPTSLAIGMVYIYFILLVAYFLLRRKNNRKAAAAVSAVASGVLLIFLSGIFGAGVIFSIVGLCLLLVGMLAVVSFLAPPTEALFARKIENIVSQNMDLAELRKLLDSIPDPCAFLERDLQSVELVLAHNRAFSEMLHMGKKKLEGLPLHALLSLPSGDKQFEYEGEEWTIKRTAKGRQVLLLFSPVTKSVRTTKLEVYDAIDPATGLYVLGFMKYKARADVESIVRGKRRMAVALFRLACGKSNAIEATDEEKRTANVTLGRVVVGCIRACDSAYLAEEGEVLLLMPDTTCEGADIVISRIDATLRRTVFVECPSLAHVALLYTCEGFVGGTDLPPYDRILDAIRVSFYTKNPDVAA